MKVRHNEHQCRLKFGSFNSRTCEGATIKYFASGEYGDVSIHAPVKVRHYHNGPNPVFCVSIHAPVKVRRKSNPNQIDSSGVSIHAPVKVRRTASCTTCNKRRFNSRTCEGATTTASIRYFLTVSIHAPVKVRRIDLMNCSIDLLFQFTHL